MANLIEKVYSANKKIFHKGNGELHHIWGRIGIFKCCPVLWRFLTHPEHENYKLLKQLREETRVFKQMIEGNYVKQLGCKRQIFNICLKCKMPIIEEEKVMRIEKWYGDYKKRKNHLTKVKNLL